MSTTEMTDGVDVVALEVRVGRLEDRMGALEEALTDLVFVAGLRSRVPPGSKLDRIATAGQHVAVEREHQKELAKARAVVARLEVQR